MLRRLPSAARQAGFTLVEVVVGLAILALIAAVVLVAVSGRIQDSRSAAVAQTLSTMSDGIIQYRADVRRYPKNLRYLSTQPTFGVTDLCNQAVPSSFVSLWKGPYTTSVLLASGLAIQEMVVQDALELDPAGPYTVTTNGAIVIVTQNVDSTIARELETRFDGNADWAAGTIRFTHLASGQGTLRYAVPVRGC